MYTVIVTFKTEEPTNSTRRGVYRICLCYIYIIYWPILGKRNRNMILVKLFCSVSFTDGAHYAPLSYSAVTPSSRPYRVPTATQDPGRSGIVARTSKDVVRTPRTGIDRDCFKHAQSNTPVLTTS